MSWIIKVEVSVFVSHGTQIALGNHALRAQL